MLRALGYELVEEPSSTMRTAEPMPASQPTDERDRSEFAVPSQLEAAPDASPLPAYNLDEIDEPEMDRDSGFEPSGHPPRAGQSGAAAPPWQRDPPNGEAAGAQGAFGRGQHRLEEIDDPFADAPLPAFPLEAPTRTDSREAPRGAAELESALEEAEFFASRGLYDDARAILDEQMTRLPNHPLLLERLAELEAQERNALGGSGTRPAPVPGGVEDRAFDIAESLGALEAERPSTQAIEEPPEQVDVEEVFAKFKEGVAKQIGADDAQSHYDLGVAYQAMGLHDDAVREFETAAQDSRRACVCFSMIGMLHLERGHINEAIASLLRGLEAPERTREQEASLAYELGTAHEVKKMNKQALEYFQHAARLAPGFRDVAERVRRLQRTEPKQPTRAVAVGADDEFDRAFDDILGKQS